MNKIHNQTRSSEICTVTAFLFNLSATRGKQRVQSYYFVKNISSCTTYFVFSFCFVIAQLQRCCVLTMFSQSCLLFIVLLWKAPVHHLAPGGIDTDALLIIDWTPVKEGGGISQTQPVWMLCEGKVLFSDVLVLAGTTVFKRSERRGGRTAKPRRPVGSGRQHRLATLLCAATSSKTTEISFNGSWSHFTDPREILRGLALTCSAATGALCEQNTDAGCFCVFRVTDQYHTRLVSPSSCCAPTDPTHKATSWKVSISASGGGQRGA